MRRTAIRCGSCCVCRRRRTARSCVTDSGRKIFHRFAARRVGILVRSSYFCKIEGAGRFRIRSTKRRNRYGLYKRGTGAYASCGRRDVRGRNGRADRRRDRRPRQFDLVQHRPARRRQFDHRRRPDQHPGRDGDPYALRRCAPPFADAYRQRRVDRSQRHDPRCDHRRQSA